MKKVQPSTFHLPPSTAKSSRWRWRLDVECWALNAPKSILLFVIRVYQLAVSPGLPFLFGSGGGCRFTPSCSHYAADAIRAHGALTGGRLAVKRICRCHPWCEGGQDPVPKEKFGVRPSPLRSDAAWVEACRAGGEGGNSEFGI